MVLALIGGGAAAGFLAGVFGIGGGAIIIPVLIHVYQYAGLEATEAIRLSFGTSLATMAFTGLSSFLSHKQHGNVDLIWLRKLFLPAGVGAAVGAILATHIPGAWLAVGLSIMLAYFGVKMLIQRERVNSVSPFFNKIHHLAGFFSGVAYSLAGMGGASIITFYLINIGLPLRKAIGTATGVILPISIGAILGFGITAGVPRNWRWGYIDLHALLIMGICSVIFSRFGVMMAAKLPVSQLRKIFGIFMLALAFKTFFIIFK